MKFTDLASPGIILSQVWPSTREKEGETLRAMETVLESGFFECIQTVEIPFRKERLKIAKLAGNGGVALNYCLTRVLNENRLNLSDVDSSIRKKSIEKVMECFEHVQEAGAEAVALVSGPRPVEEADRREALCCLTHSLYILCEEAQKAGGLKMAIEPLDYYAHKRNTLGTTEEAVRICRELEKNGLELRLAIDTAHVMLNGESVAEAIKLSQKYATDFHFCNSVLDPASALYGDYHLPFGEPGFLGLESAAAIMKDLEETGFFNQIQRPKVFCEVLKREKEDSHRLMQYCGNFLYEAWKLKEKLSENKCGYGDES